MAEAEGDTTTARKLIAEISVVKHGALMAYFTRLARRLGISAERVPLDAHSFDVDTTKIRTVLGWQPKDDVFSMLDAAIAGLTA